MKNKNYLARLVAVVLISAAVAACTKSAYKIEKAAAPSVGADSVKLSTNLAPVTTFTYTVKPTDWMVDGTNIPPGATIYIPAGKRGALLLKNIRGTAVNPIIITNQGGRVTFSTSVTASYGFKTQYSQYFKVLGNGTAGITYGFEVNGGNIGMTMDDLSSDFEIANIEVHNSGFAGIMAKTDPTCDPATWRGHFSMKNVIIRGSYVHKTGGEGLYIGNSFYADGVSLSCGKVLPHDVIGLKVFQNLTDSTGSEGIQVGSAVSSCEIYGNTVKNPGVSPFSAYQDNGIQIGEGTGGRCFNNIVKNAPGDGIIVLGLGDNLLFNNYIINSKAYGIFADSRYTPGPNFQFINNTIINSLLGGIKLNSEIIPKNTVINNVIIQSTPSLAIIKKSSSVKLTASNNYIGTDVNACKFVNYNAGNYRLLPSSPFIDKGVNVLSYSISFDYFGIKRPSGAAFDIGAAEY